MTNLAHDVVVIGGGPVGCTTALAYQERGARVLVLEANARASGRFAGEWLHPPAVEILESLGVDLRASVDYDTGLGFAVFPEDGSPPIPLPYPGQNRGLSLPHERLVSILRAKVRARGVDFLEGARATDVRGQVVEYRSQESAASSIHAARIVGASGRAGVARRVAGGSFGQATCSRMAGVVLRGATLPFEGYGHVFLGGPGPVLAYRISRDEVRVCLDVPLSLSTRREGPVVLYEAYAPALPEPLREPFRIALTRAGIEWAINQTSPRRGFGREGFSLVGDAVGHFHPLTAAGLTLGFQDALSLSRTATFDAYRQQRATQSRIPEILAIALYEVFSGTSDELVEIRRAVFSLFRASETERRRTMRLLSCEVVREVDFGVALSKVLGIAAGNLAAASLRGGGMKRAARTAQGMVSVVRGWIAPAEALRQDPDGAAPATREPLHAVPSHPGPSAPTPLGAKRTGGDRPKTLEALERGARALIALQDEDGSWEGECVWCPLLAAEYVLAWHVMGRPIDAARGRRILLHFDRMRLEGGLWGLSQTGEPSLFVTTLVYVAARLLGLSADHESLVLARGFFAREGGVEAIPTWGKFWLALVSLYRFEGMNPVIPELWAMPLASPIHPARYYCHTRLIYVAMAALHAERLQAPVTSLIETLREELFPQGFSKVDFGRTRNALRPADLFAPPSRLLLGGYQLLRLVDRHCSREGRARLLSELRSAIRWELDVTQHTAISPVSGLLDMLALWAHDREDPDVARAAERFECWIWEDEQDGMRVTGARSAIWDTSLAVQALGAAAPHLSAARTAALRGAHFLESQQIRTTFAGYAENHRSDPNGGYPFSWAWHGWPVSDCTAEALLARLAAPGNVPSDDDVALAAAFVLRSQGKDGGFGSYEARRVPFSIEWLNPAEMFGDSMTEAGYVECTASCITLLARIAAERPHLLRHGELASLPESIRRGARSIRQQQLESGAWPGAWGVRFIYGTWFGVRGLLAAGARPTDPAIRKACEWLKAEQREDGSWGERLDPRGTSYAPHEEGQIVQTAWALLALLDASEPDFGALESAAQFLGRAQLGNGQWPKQEPCGLFFRTARLEYVLYRSYFPIWALASFETRRASRALLSVAPTATREAIL